MEGNGKLYLTRDESVLFDTNYRYKISLIEISHTIKKGTKITVLTNVDKFSKELMFDKNILIRIIGKKLSCKSGFDKTNNYYYLQGDHSIEQVKEILYGFIKEYLLCIMCDKPEVNITYKNTQIKQKCRACGNKSYLTNGDVDIVRILSRYV